MITKTLSKRLERLEELVMPAGEPQLIQVNYLDEAGQVVDSYQVVVQPSGPTIQGQRPSRGWK